MEFVPPPQRSLYRDVKGAQQFGCALWTYKAKIRCACHKIIGGVYVCIR
jgi:hypothetical protein